MGFSKKIEKPLYLNTKFQYMKRIIVPLAVFLVLVLSPISSTVISDGPYMIAHRDTHEDAVAYWKHAYERTLIHEDMTLVYIGYGSCLDSVHERSCTSSEGRVFTSFADAANEGLVSEIWWVLPDYLYENCKESGFLSREVSNCTKEGDHIVCVLDSGSPSAQCTTVPVHVVGLEMLPPLEGEVLLDIDMDYFYKNGAPWISVDTFMRTLASLQIRSRMVTMKVHAQEEYFYFSWALTGRIDEYLSGFYGCSMKKKSFSIA